MIEDLIRRLHELPEDIHATVHNQGGGHLNHSLFWEGLTPDGSGKPTGELAKAMIHDFGSFDAFKAKFEEAGPKQFASGWVALVANDFPRSDSTR